MHPRHAARSASGLAALLLLLGAAAATTSVTVTVGPDGVTAEVETDDIPKLPPEEEEPPRPDPNQSKNFSVSISPPSQNGTAGKALHYTVLLSSRRDVVVDLQAFTAPDFRATLSQTEVAVAAGSNATVDLTLETPSYTASTHIWINATARDNGENRVARASASVRAPPPPPPAEIRLAFNRSEANVSAGSNTSFVAYVSSTADRTVSLSLGNVTPGYRAFLSPDSVFAGPNHTGASTLSVWADENATTDGIVEVLARTAEGETTRARVLLRLVDGGPRPMPNGTHSESAADEPASAEPLSSPDAPPRPTTPSCASRPPTAISSWKPAPVPRSQCLKTP